MGKFEVSQRTSDGMFNATALLKQWNLYGNKKRDLDDFLIRKQTKEYITVIKSKENPNTQNSGYLKCSDVLMQMRGKGGGTWMHPYLFIDFAMWLNVEFKYDVIGFVYDQLVKYRNEAGDAYRGMSGAVAGIVAKDEAKESIQKVAKACNYIVFNFHESGIRNKQADESKMKELFELERRIAQLIGDGFIKSYDHLIGYLQVLWRKKWQSGG
jgi:hypothetical protein